jgi:antagonist of KipI
MAAVKIVRAGLFTTVQDCGRWGFQARGVPVCGAMDICSHRVANGLVGNGGNAATLEVTLTGPHVQFGGATIFAVAGAEFRLTLDETPVEMNQAICARPGSHLRFGDRLKGARAYLAIAGGIQVPPVLNSRSTHVLSGMGGYQGRVLRAGDLVNVDSSASDLAIGSRPLFRPPLSLPAGGARLRMLPGEQCEQLLGQRFRISTRSDRMGYRLEGAAAGTATAAALISSAVPHGAIQLPPQGQPILLMADHATTGGYAVAATVIAADLPLAGQLAPGDWIEFEPCSLEAADAALRASEQALAGMPW